jgi:hypothetical protein
LYFVGKVQVLLDIHYRDKKVVGVSLCVFIRHIVRRSS